MLACTIDFRVGGREYYAGGPVGQPPIRMDAIYYDIIPNERIIWTYDMHMGDDRISVSLNTIRLEKTAGGRN